VQAARKTGETEAESESSAPAAITPLDTFPPAAPTGASAIAGTASIELNWDRNTESDFKNYRIFRAAGSGNFEKIADAVEAPAFSDRAIVSGTAYRYVITAVDQTGNESPQSNIVEITAP
jgi:fibronectin type 3 domain-containing protein